MPHAVSDPPSPQAMDEDTTPRAEAVPVPVDDAPGDASTLQASAAMRSSPPAVGVDAGGNEFDEFDEFDDVEMSDALAAMDPSSPVKQPVPSASAPSKPLEDLFDDDDDNDMEAAAAAFDAANVLDLSASDPEVMQLFYQRLFPWRLLFQWLNHSPSPTNDFAHREFAFTLQNQAYLRYQAFASADQLRKEVLRLMPSRFEIGPVYNSNPVDRKSLPNPALFKPLAKELCFDIDLTDYDDVRTCCGKANICNKCWQFMTMAIRVIDVALRDDFGFRHILWVYSGRRGAHAWVCDRRARALDDQKRKAIVGYLELLRGGSHVDKRVHIRRPMHPHLARSLGTLKEHFQRDVLEDQDPWDTPRRAEKLLKMLPDRGLVEALRRKWAAAPTRSSTDKWADIDAVAKTSGLKSLDAKLLLEAKQDIVLEYTYPRLDAGVSKKLNHLLKSPFVVHPGTGRVCVPMDVARLEHFDPLAVPTVQSLLNEIDEWGKQNPDTADTDTSDEKHEKLQDWEKTSLRPYIEQFRAFVLALLRDEADTVRIKRERDTLDF